ncbi:MULTISPECIES: hypothetical protein [unclassified Mesorhizobium]|uniref:hypothetical protein n=1 Tax=unclassified Mesorhizobium TaxID=325217 RepID=UPI000FDC4EC9|nr:MULTISPECIES: hypothetical protein [unclassified Mesorhizobium]TGQ04853.1 hypothetical protein EN862_031690 [Mesorhizobium sp. M2E.F.Ca.ET.219.01.1.1]TGS14416.1 hypothetical protein EN852_014495 [Mesorhizobium sp. M2E.F.Ca.ET.209.01.1.1]TGT65437.1 hypothetical protein EN809_031810 [Mesorhizobium sp. M2E.F.Ca.ET.166.01.1.1]TGV97483.1 hypothetical protein EN797_031820 [Mesorhizobium sp. M2E.F.Ca.ET.154.01.1.1]
MTGAATDKSFFEAYLQQFPDGVFAALARLKIDAIKKRMETERHAQLPEAERATNANDGAKGTELASLECRDRLVQSSAPTPDASELVRATQGELLRIGCLWSRANGEWAASSRKA